MRRHGPFILESESEQARYRKGLDSCEQRYAPFEFRLANWDTNTVVALVRESKQEAGEYWRPHGITHEYICFGTAYGDTRNQVSCMLIGCYHDPLPSASFVKDIHPELIICLDQYQQEEWLQLSRLARVHLEDIPFSAPPALFAGRPPMQWRIPQRRGNSAGSGPLHLATVSIEQPCFELYEHMKALMQSLGPRSILIDLRSGPDTHKELQRRQHLKRNTCTWPRGERAAQLLHPIGLRGTFGMKYTHLPGIVHVARRWYGSETCREWLLRPEQCDILVHLIMQGHPLVLVDEPEPGTEGLYRSSLRRAIVLHLLSLFSQQIEVVPEETFVAFSASPSLAPREG